MDRPLIEPEYRHNGERLLRMLQRQHPEYHPILSIAKIAHDAETKGGLEEIALKAHATVLKYVEPELRAIEVRNALNVKRTIEVSLFTEAEELTESNGQLALPAKAQRAEDLSIIDVPEWGME